MRNIRPFLFQFLSFFLVYLFAIAVKSRLLCVLRLDVQSGGIRSERRRVCHAASVYTQSRQKLVKGRRTKGIRPETKETARPDSDKEREIILFDLDEEEVMKTTEEEDFKQFY